MWIRQSLGDVVWQTMSLFSSVVILFFIFQAGVLNGTVQYKQILGLCNIDINSCNFNIQSRMMVTSNYNRLWLYYQSVGLKYCYVCLTCIIYVSLLPGVSWIMLFSILKSTGTIRHLEQHGSINFVNYDCSALILVWGLKYASYIKVTPFIYFNWLTCFVHINYYHYYYHI